MADENSPDVVELTAQIVAAYVENNPVPASELPTLIERISGSVSGLTRAPEPPAAVPAVPVKRSVRDDYIVCLEDGKKFKSLRRHITAQHGMTPDEYREKWKLPPDYPMVAPSYSQARAELAKAIGLGSRVAKSRGRRKAK